MKEITLIQGAATAFHTNLGTPTPSYTEIHDEDRPNFLVVPLMKTTYDLTFQGLYNMRQDAHQKIDELIENVKQSFANYVIDNSKQG